MNRKEKDLYPEIKSWFNQYLCDRYPGYKVVTTFQTAKIALDTFLKTLGIEAKEAIGLGIKIDIVGVLQRGKTVHLGFVEVKDRPLTLTDLGQLWGYTELINPLESFLISSKGLGSLDYILNVLKREDLLKYGIKQEKMMRISKWDTTSKILDSLSTIPKL